MANILDLDAIRAHLDNLNIPSLILRGDVFRCLAVIEALREVILAADDEAVSEAWQERARSALARVTSEDRP